jgi:hypothetical protein
MLMSTLVRASQPLLEHDLRIRVASDVRSSMIGASAGRAPV